MAMPRTILRMRFSDYRERVQGRHPEKALLLSFRQVGSPQLKSRRRWRNFRTDILDVERREW